jgi:hypothetical protein
MDENVALATVGLDNSMDDKVLGMSTGGGSLVFAGFG